MKIAVYTIAYNEEKHVERWTETTKDADYRLIYSAQKNDDKTIERAIALGIDGRENPNPVKNIDFRFDVARNQALDLLPEDIDVCISLDMDEFLSEGWREQLEKQWTFGTERALCKQYYGTECGPILNVCRIHSRHGCRWKYPIHEVISSSKETILVINNLIISHEPDNNKSREQYLTMLENAAIETPDDPRILFYLGREYSYGKEHYKCIETLKKYLEAGTWNAERSDACRLIVMAKMGSEDDAEVTDWCLRAIRECPTQRDSYVLFAQVLFSRKDYAVAYSLIDYAINNTGYNGYQTSGTYWDYNIYSFAARCAYYAGNLKDAIGYGNKAIALNPEDENLKRNMKIYCQEPVSK